MTDQAITDAELDRLEREWGSVAGIRKVFRDLRRLREENGNLLALTHEWDVSCVKLQARVRELEAALEPCARWIEEMHAAKRCRPECPICAGVNGVLNRARAVLEKKQ